MNNDDVQLISNLMDKALEPIAGNVASTRNETKEINVKLSSIETGLALTTRESERNTKLIEGQRRAIKRMGRDIYQVNQKADTANAKAEQTEQALITALEKLKPITDLHQDSKPYTKLIKKIAYVLSVLFMGAASAYVTIEVKNYAVQQRDSETTLPRSSAGSGQRGGG